MPRVPTILCTGIAVLDQVFQVDRFPVPQTKMRASAFAAVGGGCAGNAAVAIARLGGRVGLAAPLGGPAGEDAIGDRILAGLRRERIDCAGCVRVPGATSSISAILVDAGGEHIIVNYRDDRLAEGRADDPKGLVAAADLVLADNRFPEFALPICAAARERGLPVVFDWDKPTRDADALIGTATHIVFSAEGLRAAGEHDDLATALARVGERWRAFLAVTDGPNGMLVRDGAAIRHLSAFAVEAVDTLGAGDVFHGAFALALAEGTPEHEAMRFAAASAAVKCTRFGGISGAPTRGEADAMLGSGAHSSRQAGNFT